MPKEKGRQRHQYAALPFRMDVTGSPEILLITTRETRRWIVPKGWPIANLSPRQVAAREAYEEAGLIGTMLNGPAFGTYKYDKVLPGGAAAPCRVKVFAMQVQRQHARWPEMHQRRTRWCNPDLAATLVTEPELARIFRALPDLLAAHRVRRAAAPL